LAAVITRLRPKQLIPLGFALLVAVGPIMGFKTGLRRFLQGSVDGTPVRVVTYNIAGGAALNTSLPWIIEQTRGDIIALQECGGTVAAAVSDLPEIAWSAHTGDGVCLVSRYPITSTQQLDRENIRAAGGSGVVVTYTIDLGDRELYLTNLHLDTPRRGLAPVREGNITEGFNTLRSKSVTRDIESRQARAWVDAREGATVVVGDFNLPVESVIYRRHWGDMLNAFSRTGIGFGFTRIAGWIRARIDHVLTDDEWHVVRAFVGPDFGSDHRPMIADLILGPIR
jgi:endonuclease/exonuclease/phosphatase (EEP) superfamily protein YafD